MFVKCPAPLVKCIGVFVLPPNIIGIVGSSVALPLVAAPPLRCRGRGCVGAMCGGGTVLWGGGTAGGYKAVGGGGARSGYWPD